MSLSLWPPNPMPPVDILILIVAVLGSGLAIRRFIRDLSHPQSSATPIVIEPPSNPPPTAPA